MSVLSNKDSTMYLAQERLAEWAGIIATSSARTSKIYQNKAERLRYYLKAMQYEFFLEESEIITLLQCINSLADLQEWPTAPILTETEQPSILLGIPGQDGQDGAPGTPGTDADINAIADPLYDNMVVTEFDDNGIKTFKFGYSPHTPPTISIEVNDGIYVVEFGVIVSPVKVDVTINKGRDNVLSSTMTSPAGLDPAYQVVFGPALSSINSGNQEILTVNDTSQSSDVTYSVGVTDAKGTSSVSRALDFVVPFIYGSSATILTQQTAYANLSKLVQTKGDKTVTFNDTDAYFYFGYPSSYGYLDTILDGNGFPAMGAFTLLDATGTNELPTVDMLSGAESMIMYRTIITDIPSEKYTFKF